MTLTPRQPVQPRFPPRPRLTSAALAAAVFLLSLASCIGPSAPPAPHAETAALAAPNASAVSAVSFTPAELQLILSFSPLPPPPPDPTNAVADNPQAAHLGQFLFFDPRLSARGDVSCASCHQPNLNWSDGQRIPAKFSPKLRHVPSLWNVAYNRWFYWDGRADSLWAQALEPLEQPTEHAGNRRQYAELFARDAQLRQAYERIFGPMPELAPAPPPTAASPPTPGPPSAVDRIYTNIGKSIAAFERRLVSRHAPFDSFVEALRAGDGTAASTNPASTTPLSPAAQRGLKLFIGPANCISCHHGPNFTDGEFHDSGISRVLLAQTPDKGRADGINHLLNNPFSALGPFNDDPASQRTHPTAFLANSVERRGQFKTPTLRNVALTAPYMHRGQLDTLEAVVRFYSTLTPPLPPSTPADQIPTPEPEPAPNAAPRPSSVPAPKAPNSKPDPATAAAHTHPASRGSEGVLVPLNLSEQDISDLVEFLKTLTDVNIDPALKQRPASPLG